MYGERWDLSDLAFEKCYGDKIMLYALKCKDGDGDSTGFVEQMIQLWDDDFKFTDEELLDYIYAFPLYLKKLRQKSHSKIQKEQKPTKHKPTHEHEHAINVTEV